RAAHDLDALGTGVDDADPQAIGVGVRFGRDDMRDPERRQRRGAVGDAFDLEPQHDEAAHDLVERGCRVEMALEPAEGRLHRAAPAVMPPWAMPPTIEGTSSGTKP